MKVALLSNINIDPINRILGREENIEIFDSQGYGNELGVLLNENSAVNLFQPDYLFVFVDLMELICHELDFDVAKNRIDEWFNLFASALKPGPIIYLSDASLYGFELDIVWNKTLKTQIETEWNNHILQLLKNNSNLRMFPFNQHIQNLGEKNAFSNKMWYMGKIMYSASLQKELAEEIIQRINVESRQPKKVLLLDLDNTLWGGLAGEADIAPIVLSEDGIGLAYKNFQRGIQLLKNQGVVLGIVSKNNEEDAFSIIANHPHMVLRPNDFAAYRINWNNKADNVLEIAEELNVGLDSIVYVDDNKSEQMLIRNMLKDVQVPEFPENPETLSDFVLKLYHGFFEKPFVTEEDKTKTSQYRENRERKKLLDTSADFSEYLNSLEMKMYRMNPNVNKDRFLQLVNKTNQFNLTTQRYTAQELSDLIDNPNKEVFLYKIVDRFGDNGIVVAAIVEYGEEAIITEFTMSCRVMGRKIEEAVIDEIESCVKMRGFKEIVGLYKPTEKNKPVRDLYINLGYTFREEYDDGTKKYCGSTCSEKKRNHHVEIAEEK